MGNKIFFNFFFEKVAQVLHQNRVNYNDRKKRQAVTIGKDSFFAEESRVFDLQNKHTIIIGSNTFIRGELLTFAHGGNIQIGNWCYIGEHTKIWSAKNIVIGDNVLISHNVNIHDSNAHPTDSVEREKQYEAILTTGHPKGGIDLNEKEVIIKNKVWIGFNAIILKGVTIGEGAIIGAGSVVVKDVEAWTVVAGNPAQIIRYLLEYKKDRG